MHTLQDRKVPGKFPLDRSGEHDVMFLTCEDDDNSHNIILHCEEKAVNILCMHD